MLNPTMLRKVARFRAEAAQLEHSIDVFRKEQAEQLSHAEEMLVMGAAQSVGAAESALLGLEWATEDRRSE